MQSSLKIFSSVALGLLLSGCSGWSNPFHGWYGGNPFTGLFGTETKVVPPPEPNVMPTNYRTRLLQFLERELYDPTGVRDAYISEPKLRPFGTESRYTVCVRYNAKAGYGEYTGIKEYIGIYFHGDLTQFIPAAPGQCADAAYVRWPELETLKKRSS
jgi:hypothetical protein